jgi:membrane protein DedA with SNARE-associated domain
VVAGLAYTKTKITSFIFLIASIIWATALVSLGYYFGEQVTFKSITTVSLVIALIVIFFVYKAVNKQIKK